jgi:hypothetical protein
MKNFALALAVGAGLMAVATPAMAAKQDFAFGNGCTTPITSIKLSHPGENNWSENMIDGKIAPGDAKMVELEEGQGECAYDVEITTGDGTYVLKNVNTCNHKGMVASPKDDETLTVEFTD